MAQERLSLEPEVQEIFRLIDGNHNFLLSGGAGSGKTYSLVQVIRQCILENPTAHIACMTYTNAAVKEIEDRVDHKNLNVTTIHDFLWDNIKHFQKELKSALVSLANDENVSKVSIDGIDPVPDDYFDNLSDGIQYKEYLRIRDGIISHDELLIVANYMFSKYPKLNDVVKDKFNFIFVDEYQDTHKLVIEILLSHFQTSNRKNIIGFFGDAMQSIYDDGIGNLDQYKMRGTVVEVQKSQNRRNPNLIIGLANRLRTDGIIQTPSLDTNAPNMTNGNVRNGKISFLYSSNDDISKVKRYLTGTLGWDFLNPLETKELNLTHNLIADQAGFKNLMDIYDKDQVIGLKSDILAKIKDNRRQGRAEIVISENDTFDEVVNKFQLKNRQGVLKKELLIADGLFGGLYDLLKTKRFVDVRKIYINKDSLIDDKKQNEADESRKGSKRDNLIKHLFKIQSIINFYVSGQYNEFLRLTDYRIQINKISDKQLLKRNIESLIDVGDKTIQEIIAEANISGICLIDDRLIRFISQNEYLYDRIKILKFSEFQKLYEYLEGKTPFSTQHKTKGREFNNVLVILDNGDWNNYNFENLFLGNGTPSVLARTQKIFYVCCTRSKENLAVFYHQPTHSVLAKAQTWFGQENIINLDQN